MSDKFIIKEPQVEKPSLNFVRRYLPAFGGIDLSPIVVFLGLWFIKSLLIEYWPR